MSETEATPIPAHICGEFYLWLWWASEHQASRFDLADPVGTVHVWVDERLAFRLPDDTKVTAIMTGENPANSLEARAALAGGKVIQEVRIGIRRDDREFFATLKGPSLHVGALKLPQVLSEADDEAVYDRMFLYEEFALILKGLLRRFSDVRTASSWSSEVVPAVRTWLVGEQG
jgi:hypothetical protein